MKDLRFSLAFVRELQKDYRRFLVKLISERGDAFKVKSPSYNLHFIANPHYIEEILFNRSSIYLRPSNHVLNTIFGVSDASLAKSNIEWQKDRLSIINSFLNDQFVKKYTASLVETTTAHLNKWEDYLVQAKPLPISSIFSPPTLENFLKTLLGGVPLNLEYTSGLVREAHFLIAAYERSITRLPWILPSRWSYRTRQVKNELRKISLLVVDHCLSNKAPEDNVIRNIAKNHVSDKNSNVHLSTKAIALLLGGFDTVAVDMAWVCIYLSLHPDIMEKVYNEVMQNIGDRQLTSGDINKLPFTRAVILETLRLVPLPFLPRFAVADDTIDQYVIKKNDRILIPLFYIHRLPEYWENPEGFNPNRFLSPLEDRYRTLYLPFSGGPRGCLGKNFALLEMTITLAMIAQRYRLYLTPNQLIDPDHHFSDPKHHAEITMTVHRARSY